MDATILLAASVSDGRIPGNAAVGLWDSRRAPPHRQRRRSPPVPPPSPPSPASSAAGHGAARAGPVRPCRVGPTHELRHRAWAPCRCGPTRRIPARSWLGHAPHAVTHPLWLVSGTQPATSHGPSAGLLAGVSDRRPVSPLPLQWTRCGLQWTRH